MRTIDPRNDRIVDSVTGVRLSRRSLLRLGGIAVLAVGTLGLSACGGGKKRHRVTMTNEMVFEPASLTVKKGETVTWKNEGSMVHTVTADRSLVLDPALVLLPDGASPFHSGNVADGAEWSMTFDQPGTYRYVCVPHELANMVGEIIVEA